MNERNIDEGSDNLFADLALPDAGEMLLKSSMVIQLRRLMEARTLSQTAAAKLMGISQSDLSKLLRGRFRGYSMDRLIRMLTAFDQDVDIVVRQNLRPGEPARVTFNPVSA